MARDADNPGPERPLAIPTIDSNVWNIDLRKEKKKERKKEKKEKKKRRKKRKKKKKKKKKVWHIFGE